MIPTLLLAAVAAGPVSCPLTLPRETVTVKAPVGWSGYSSPEFIRLTGFGLMAGPPETLSYLAPIKSTKATITWRIDPDTPRWLYCTYDHGTAIQISRKLPDGGTSCSISYRETKQDGITAVMAVCDSGR